MYCGVPLSLVAYNQLSGSELYYGNFLEERDAQERRACGPALLSAAT